MNRKFKHVGGDATRQRNKLLKDLQIFNSKKQTHWAGETLRSALQMLKSR
jgi:hypothetical protein